MYLSLNWLKDFVKIPSSMTPEELGLRLTMHTVEVDEITRQADKFKGVMVGQVLKLDKHPNADRLQVVTVTTGTETLKIVCGATNLAVGQFVPVALPGATLPNGLAIKKSEIRGVESNGMLCAEDELGLGEDHSGILILDKKAKVGKNLGEFLGLKDVIFSVDNKSINHRPDLWSHQGMAREIAAFLGAPFKPYLPGEKSWKVTGEAEAIKVKVEDFALCPRYMAISVGDIKIEPSPKWLQDRLIAGGVRPISNIVDVTNYVLLELGQPLHAFDRALIDEIIVRRAGKGETIETLDGSKRSLETDMLVIASSRQPIAVAGVMGGANSEIGEATTAIVIESANFDFLSVRRTAQKLGLRTEASIRYEKALDPNLCELGIKRAVELIRKLCPSAKVTSALTDEKKYELNQSPIALDLDWLNARIGEALPAEAAVAILKRLGFSVEPKERTLSVTPPSWRATRDITCPEDLVEEVARIHGYNNLHPHMPLVEMKAPEVNEPRQFERKIKVILTGAPAFVETENHPFVGEDQLAKLGIDFSAHRRLANPIASQQALLRQDLMPNLANNIRTNQARFDHLRLFEIGSVYLSAQSEIPVKAGSDEDKLPYQERRLGLVIAGDRRGKTFTQAKAAVGYLGEALNLFKSGQDNIYAPLVDELKPVWADVSAAAAILIGGQTVGTLVRLDARPGRKAGIKKEATFAELNLRLLFQLYRGAGEKRFEDAAKYPPVIRDLAFVVNEKIEAAEIIKEIHGFDPLIAKVELFDSFTGGKLGSGKRNVAFHIVYQSDRTLTTAAVDKLQKGLVRKMEEKFEAKIRDF